MIDVPTKIGTTPKEVENKNIIHVQCLFIVGMPHRMNKIEHVIFCLCIEALILVETSYNHTHSIQYVQTLLTAKCLTSFHQ